MFVCDYCRENALEHGGVGIIRSRGACELCGYTDGCFDVHGYKIKDNWKDLIYKEKVND